MARIVFVDTSAFMARYLPDDQYHEAAVAEYERLVRAGCHFMTSNYIFDEVVTGVQRRADHATARRVGNAILEHKRLIHFLVDEELEKAAWRLHEKFNDQELSFTDVTSVAVMRQLKLDEIFSFDSDFDHVGLTRLPRRP